MKIVDVYSSWKNEFPKGKEGICLIDGAVQGNPGQGGIGIVLREKQSDKSPLMLSREVGEVTNNEAEWLAFIEALRLAKEKGFTKLEVITDSQLLLRQWEGTYKTRARNLQKLLQKARHLAEAFEELKIVKGERKETQQAHRLANKAIVGRERK